MTMLYHSLKLSPFLDSVHRLILNKEDNSEAGCASVFRHRDSA
jgi:hypothetical protein